MVATSRGMTLEEFLALPEEKPYLELVDGEVWQKGLGTTAHAHAQVGLALLLRSHPATRRGTVLTELTMPFGSTARANARVPDLAYFRAGRTVKRPYPDEPADLVVEIRSPGQSIASQRERLAFLHAQGVASTLLVDPEQGTVTVHDQGREWTVGRGEQVALPGLEGFSFAVADILLD